jgi:hypothetical protein
MSNDVYVTETRQDGSTYERKLYGVERMERAEDLAEKIAGLRQVIEADAAGNLDCNWSDDSVRALAAESLKAIESVRADLTEALRLFWQFCDESGTFFPPTLSELIEKHGVKRRG